MSLPLKLVDGLTLGAPHRSLLMPGALVRDAYRRTRRLPRFFYAVDSWDVARQTMVTPHFALWELMDVDLHEPLPLRTYPRYIPCAVTALAAHLEVFRTAMGQPVKIAANGAYRSPSHAKTGPGSTHCWGTAANIFRIGDDYLDDRDKITRYGTLAMSLIPAARARPYGELPGGDDDHLHLDIGHVIVLPNDAPSEE